MHCHSIVCLCFTSARTQQTLLSYTQLHTYKIDTQSQPLACLYNYTLKSKALRYEWYIDTKKKRSRRYLIYLPKYMGKTTHGCDPITNTNVHFIVSHSVSLSFRPSCDSNGHYKYIGPKTKRTENAVDKYYRILPKPFVEKYAVTWTERSVWF